MFFKQQGFASVFGFLAVICGSTELLGLISGPYMLIATAICTIANGLGNIFSAEATKTPVKVMTFFAIFFIPIMGTAFAAELAWDRVSDSRVTAYNIYGCSIVAPATTCTINVNASGDLRGTVLQPSVVSAIPSWSIPSNINAVYAVTSRTPLLESGLSVTVPFNSMLPAIPVNPRVGP